MPVVPDPLIQDPTTQELVESIVAQRGSLLQLYATLLHSPPIAKGWLELLTGIRQKSTLPEDLREMVILRIAQLNDAPYEYAQHLPIALRCGFAQEKVDALNDWLAHQAVFTSLELAVLELTDDVTTKVRPQGDAMVRVRAHLSDRQVVELAVTIAAYNMVSRFLEVMEIH